MKSNESNESNAKDCLMEEMKKAVQFGLNKDNPKDVEVWRILVAAKEPDDLSFAKTCKKLIRQAGGSDHLE